LKYIKNNKEVHVVYLTNGNKNGNPQERKNEAIYVSSTVGIHRENLYFLSSNDAILKLKKKYFLALPLYILYVLIFELYFGYGLSELWSRFKRFSKKGKKASYNGIDQKKLSEYVGKLIVIKLFFAFSLLYRPGILRVCPKG